MDSCFVDFLLLAFFALSARKQCILVNRTCLPWIRQQRRFLCTLHAVVVFGILATVYNLHTEGFHIVAPVNCRSALEGTFSATTTTFSQNCQVPLPYDLYSLFFWLSLCLCVSLLQESGTASFKTVLLPCMILVRNHLVI
jgi:hypothetical protein